ncbi:MAG TPA: DUF559 domain-containing protein [Micropruina sp.]|nr:DUF559 domain-containing protein [Micropruina sp.]
MDFQRRAMEVLRVNGDVLSRRLHARATINTLVGMDAVVQVFPGVFVAADKLTVRSTRYAAALAARPTAVLWAESAVAALTGDARAFVKGEVIRLAQPVAARIDGLRITRRSIPPAEVRHFHGLRCPAPALVAVDLAARDDGRVAEAFLRDGLVRPDELVDALVAFQGSPSQQCRRQVVASFADNPWSGGERELQQVLRDAGLTGWVANQRLTLFGLICYPDILFADAGLIIEFDGYVVHSSKGAFESDRHRQNQLVLAGYRVLRFTWQQLKDDPAAVVREIRAALAQGEPVIC